VLDHYRALFARLHLARAFANSTIIAVAATVCGADQRPGGLRLRQAALRGRDRIFRLLLIGLVIPVQVGMLPLFLLFKSLGLANTLAGV
jgi:multiple sugar transport system permease protein